MKWVLDDDDLAQLQPNGSIQMAARDGLLSKEEGSSALHSCRSHLMEVDPEISTHGSDAFIRFSESGLNSRQALASVLILNWFLPIDVRRRR